MDLYFSIASAGGGTTLSRDIGRKDFPALVRMMADAIEHNRIEWHRRDDVDELGAWQASWQVLCSVVSTEVVALSAAAPCGLVT